MTLEEKVLQMQNSAPAISRLGVGVFNYWNEALHGVASGRATVFPEPVGMGASFDPDLVHRVADAISTVARAKYHEAQRRPPIPEVPPGSSPGRIAWLTYWSPNINIFRDPRWGRGQETYGEDPYLTSRMGVAFVTGMQGDDPHYLKVVATPKHYAVHSGPEPLRHTFDPKPSEYDLLNTYLPAFKAAVVEGKADSVMCVYNSVDGVPGCASTDLLEKRLRQSLSNGTGTATWAVFTPGLQVVNFGLVAVYASPRAGSAAVTGNLGPTIDAGSFSASSSPVPSFQAPSATPPSCPATGCIWASPDALSFTPSSPTNAILIHNAANFFATVSAGSPWLSVSGTSFSLQINVSPTGLAPGIYTATITINAIGANTITVPVVLTIGTTLAGVPITCTQNIGVSTPTSRVEGFTEATGDVLAICTGGIQGAVQNVNVQVTTSAPITSRTLDPSSQATEALLPIDDPNSGEPGSINTFTVGSNVFQGTLTGPNTIISQMFLSSLRAQVAQSVSSAS